MGLMACLNLTGAVTYTARVVFSIKQSVADELNESKVPERWHPYRYDIWGCSHQILHITVMLAGLAHMGGLIKAFDFLHSQGALCG